MINYTKFKLYKDGINAFPMIIDYINKSEKSIFINMFIWRDDQIGNKVLESVYDACNRGVKVEISIDRFATVFEYYEESRRSMFHPHPSLFEKFQTLVMSIFYPSSDIKISFKTKQNELAVKLINHPNCRVIYDQVKADHSKFYIIDDKVLILGGINIEDKENGIDKEGRFYQDYMTSIEDSDLVKEFKQMYFFDQESELFKCNNIMVNPHKYHMFDYYLELLNSSSQRIEITMPYFAFNKKIVNALISAFNRGVKITILIPLKSNHADASNKKLVKYLMKKTNNGINLLFSFKMVHTKLMIVDDTITTGSCNINKSSFNILGEVNLNLKIDNSNYINSILKSVNENYLVAKKIDSYKQIKYNYFVGLLEKLIN